MQVQAVLGYTASSTTQGLFLFSDRHLGSRFVVRSRLSHQFFSSVLACKYYRIIIKLWNVPGLCRWCWWWRGRGKGVSGWVSPTDRRNTPARQSKNKIVMQPLYYWSCRFVPCFMPEFRAFFYCLHWGFHVNDIGYLLFLLLSYFLRRVPCLIKRRGYLPDGLPNPYIRAMQHDPRNDHFIALHTLFIFLQLHSNPFACDILLSRR